MGVLLKEYKAITRTERHTKKRKTIIAMGVLALAYISVMVYNKHVNKSAQVKGVCRR